MVAPAPIFDPPPDHVGLIVADLASTHLALDDLAREHDTTIDALSVWTVRPDIRDRLAAIETLAALRARLAAAAHLPLAIGALVDMIQAARWEETHVPLKGDLLSQSLRDRQRTNTRRAASLLLRLARFYPTPPTSPTPRPTTSHPRTPGHGAGDDNAPPRLSPDDLLRNLPIEPPVPAAAIHENGSPNGTLNGADRATDRAPDRPTDSDGPAPKSVPEPPAPTDPASNRASARATDLARLAAKSVPSVPAPSRGAATETSQGRQPLEREPPHPKPRRGDTTTTRTTPTPADLHSRAGTPSPSSRTTRAPPTPSAA